MSWLTSRVHPAKLKHAVESADFALKRFYGRLLEMPAAHAKPELENAIKNVGLAAYAAGAEYARGFFPLTKLALTPDHPYSQDIDRFLASLDMRLPDSAIDIIHESLEQGRGLPTEKLAPKLGYETAKGVARSTIMNVYARGALKQWKQEGVKHVKRIAVEDNRTCPVCRGLNGKEYLVRQLLTLPNPQSWDTHLSCLVGETMVLAPGARSGFVSRYEGPGVKVVFEGGVITCTANHMFLTPQGFAKASSLREGDDVFYSPAFQGPEAGYPHDDGQPAPIKDVVAALAELPGMARGRVPVASEYLHGDGAFIDADIDIVTANGLVGRAGQSPRAQLFEKLFLQGAPEGAFAACSDLGAVLLAMARSADGGVGPRGEGQAFLSRHALHSEQVGLAASADLQAGVAYQSVDDLPGNAEAISQRLGGGAFAVAGHDLTAVGVCEPCAQLLGFGERTDRYPVALQRQAYDLVGHSEISGDLGDRFSGRIALRKILRIESVPLRCHVYDLQTESTLYLANGLVSSNCRCTFVPVINISTYAPKKLKEIDLRQNIRVGQNVSEDTPIELAGVMEEALRGGPLPFKVRFDPEIKSDYEFAGGEEPTLTIHPKTLADEDPREIIWAEAAERLWPRVQERVEKEYRPLVESGYASSVRSWDTAKELFVNNYTGFRLGQLDNDLWSQVFFRSIAK